jgi:hypothetical protein
VRQRECDRRPGRIDPGVRLRVAIDVLDEAALERERIARENVGDAIVPVEGDRIEDVDRALEDDVADFGVARGVRPPGPRYPLAVLAIGGVGPAR